jgi:hypothetical protein
MDTGRIVGIAIAAIWLLSSWMLRRMSAARQTRLLIVRNALVFGGFALLLATAVGPPSSVRFWVVLGATAAVLLPYLAALSWLGRR